MRRLSLQIYVTIIGSLILLVILAGAIFRLGMPFAPQGEPLELAADLVAAALPPPTEPPGIQTEVLRNMSRRLGTDLALFDAQRRPIGAVGPPLPPPEPRGFGGWIPGSRPPAFSLALPDGRWLVLRPRGAQRNVALTLVLFLGALALAVALGAYPVVRRLTRRLERLQAGVESFGSGDLSARVDVVGKDEVARLAASFNRTAAHIEELMGAHRMLLANASHELRTPLSRIRMGIELLRDKDQPDARLALERDIVELDQLIDEILLASRLDVLQKLDKAEEIDLLALAAEEASRYDAVQVSGISATVSGDPRLLRRMIRNLLENAERHGVPPVDLTLRQDAASVTLTVSDHGPGIPEAERERVFEPFHRLKSSRESTGAGLGLSLVRQIARLHGGDARVIAAAGGTSFEVRLARLPLK